MTFRLKETSWLNWLRKAAILLLSLIIFVGAVYFLIYLNNIPSISQKRAYLQREELKAKIRAMVEDLVLEAGWEKRQAGIEEIYVPVVKVLVSNKSTEILRDLAFRAYFEVEGERLCLDSVPILKFDPGTNLELTLSCTENIGFGTIFKGVPLIQTTKKVSYEIGLSINNLYVPLGEGNLEFKLIKPR